MKLKQKKAFREERRRGIFILPNLITSASLFVGFYAIIAAIHGRYESAAVAIIFSSIFDGLDGRIARFTGTTSRFGTEYDSLSDLVAFGVAPAILVFSWALEPFGRLGWLAAFMFVICGALRLARFNVEKHGAPSNYFKGLPIPAAACFISSLILFDSTVKVFSEDTNILVILMIYLLSFLMVSSITYLSFKGFNIKNQKPFNVLVSIILIFIVIAYKPKILLFIIMFVYVFSGPVITIYRLYRRKILRKKLPKRAHSRQKDNSDQDESDLVKGSQDNVS